MIDSKASQEEGDSFRVEAPSQAEGPIGKGGSKTEALSAEQLRAWGHLASVAVLVLALFAFGLSVIPAGSQTGPSTDGKHATESQKETHLHVHWEEVPAILIVFILAELGVELVAAAQMVRDRVVKANEAVGSLQEESKKLRNASESSASALENRLNGVTATFDESARTLKEAVGGFKGSAELLREATILQQTGDDVWPALVQFVSCWNVDVVHTDGRSRPLVGNLFQAFIGTPLSPASVRNAGTSITCVTVDSVYAELSRLFLKGAAERKEPFVVWAVSSLHPFEFCFPRAFWSRNGHGPGRRVSSLEQFVHTVTDQCLNNAALQQYRRLTLFASQPGAGSPTLKLRPSTAVDDALDNWHIWSAEQAAEDLREKLRDYSTYAMLEWLRDHCGAADGIIPPHEFEQFVTENEARSPHEVHYLPQPPEPSKVNRYQRDADTGVAFLPSSALQLDSTSAAEALRQLYLKLGIGGPPPHVATMADALRTAGWLSVREWYCTKMHKGPRISEVARFAVINEKTHGMGAFRIELDGREWETVDLILMGTPGKLADDPPHWIAGLLSDIDFDSPACIVKLVLDQGELQRLGNAVAELWASSNASGTNGGSWDTRAKAQA